MPKKNEMSKEELDALKEELKKELLVEMKKDEAEAYKKEQEAKASTPAFKIPTKSKIDKFDRNITKENNNTQVENISASSNFFLIVILLIVLGGVYLIPVVRNMFNKEPETPEPVETKKEEKKEEKRVYEWTDKDIKNITLPIMRNDINSSESYYKNSSMTIEGFTNNDILYNAFINEYSGNIGYYYGGYAAAFCGNDSQKRELNAKYIDARVNNLFTKNAKFTHADFYVPLSSGSSYIGWWRYNASSHTYIYYGECNPQGIAGDLYYDVLVEDEIVTSDDSKTVYLTYNIGFARVLGDDYQIYKDANYTDLLISDTFKTNDHEKELKDVYKEFVKNHKVNKYKYTYSTKNCSYSELCYISGEYTNE